MAVMLPFDSPSCVASVKDAPTGHTAIPCVALPCRAVLCCVVLAGRVYRGRWRGLDVAVKVGACGAMGACLARRRQMVDWRWGSHTRLLHS